MRKKGESEECCEGEAYHSGEFRDADGERGNN